ncbi:E3 ubiquitin-protein ligase HRD1 [Copidosoma floridanum]|uniref:E3 ubiquitin-protein ligase HRD1 n=1 Tax=Copidosoma floridanum TaxID=29053 RepID=UPI0006C9B5F3|nr:E3 ubiquitin-protein ligase HRD1 [Copidosoma floridanum]
MEAVRGSIAEVQDLGRSWLRRLYEPLERAEEELLRMRNFSALAEQLAFMALADRLLLPAGPTRKLNCLYTLMFYNVLAYCFGYVRELASKGDWSPYVTLTATSSVRHLAMSATKLVLEWTKAVTFFITLVFTLLVFSFEQALHDYKPSLVYVFLTLSYYMATEKVFASMFPSALSHLELDTLESLEHLYGPLVLRLFTVSLSGLFVLLLLPVAPWRFLFASFYLNVVLRGKELARTQWPALIKERRVLSRYRRATRAEIREFDDVCAVCLSAMSRARVTPCHHLFHDTCLRQCLKNTDVCPLCKRPFVFA